MGNAGRVLMIPKGDYNAATTYERLDFVYYQGRSYVCKQTSTGNVPTNTTYWQALTGDASAEIQALTNYVTDTGVKNLLENTASSQVKGGVTFVVNDDKSITADATGTVSSIYFQLHSYSNDEYQKLFAGKTLKISGTPSNAASGIKIYAELNGTGVIDEINAPVATLPTTSGTFIVYIRIPANSSVSNLVFKPMLTDANIPNSDYAHYQPYAKTNVELTADVAVIESQITVSSGITLQDNKVNKCGNVVHVYFEITTPPDTSSSNVVIGTVPFLPRTNFAFINAYSKSNPFDIKHTVFIRGNNGEVVFPTSVTSSGVFVEGTYICK